MSATTTPPPAESAPEKGAPAIQKMALLRHYRGSPAPAVRFRCHILLLLDAGRPWGLIAAVLFTSTATINRWRPAYLRGGIDAVLAETQGRRPTRWWVGMVVRWVVTLAPADFGFARSRWSCEAVAVVLREDRNRRIIPVSLQGLQLGTR